MIASTQLYPFGGPFHYSMMPKDVVVSCFGALGHSHLASIAVRYALAVATVKHWPHRRSYGCSFVLTLIPSTPRTRACYVASPRCYRFEHFDLLLQVAQSEHPPLSLGYLDK